MKCTEVRDGFQVQPIGRKRGDRQEINLELWKISDTARGGGERITGLWADGLSLHQNQLCFQSSQEDLVSLVGTGAMKTISRAC